MKRAITVAIASVFAILAIDAIAFVASPAEPDGTGPQRPGRPYPRFYFTADRVMGFDMAADVPPTPALVVDEAYEVFTNDLACFDRRRADDFAKAPEYVYFTGDSYVWGYGSYDTKLATVFERESGRLTAKCGITHSGQRHQFAKYQQVAERIGHRPSLAIVTFFPNDVANDWAYPHTTVVDGYQVDTVYAENGALIRPAIDAVTAMVREQEARLAPGYVEPFSLRRFLRTHSWSARLADEALVNLGGSSWLAEGRPSERFGLPLYQGLPMNTAAAHYLDDERTLENRRAIEAWQDDARRHHYRVVFVLIPPGVLDVHYFDHVKTWLAKTGLDYIDLTPEFAASGRQIPEIFRSGDGHFTNEANEMVGAFLASMIRENHW